MELCYDGALVMPSSYAVMNEEEMSYVEGGEKYGYSVTYLTRTGAMCKALKIINEKKWSNIKCYDLAAEIYTHAFAYYNGKHFLTVLTSLGVKSAAEFLGSLVNGIDVQNGLDTKKFKGIPRYKIYSWVFATAPC